MTDNLNQTNNRHLRRANKSKKAKRKAIKAIKQRIPGLDLSRIAGKVVIDGIEIQGDAKPDGNLE